MAYGCGRATRSRMRGRAALLRRCGGRRGMTGGAGGKRRAIGTVEDDLEVSRAVARDLRRRYGEQHRIVRAESAPAALDALRQMKLRGDLVALILADYRMPELNGIEFFEQAMEIYPGARRVLRTAYATTGAPRDAIHLGAPYPRSPQPRSSPG